MRRSASRTVAKSAPPTTISTPTPSTLVPTMSIICRKDSMAVLIAGKCADFQCCLLTAPASSADYCSHRPVAGPSDPQRTPDERTAHRAVATSAHLVESYLALENDAGDCVMFGMAKSDQCRSYAAFCHKCFGRPRKNEKRLTAFLFLNVDVAPAHCLANAGAERF